MYKCKNCGTEFESAFCPNCGTAASDMLPEAIPENPVQKEIEQFGISETWKKYRPSENQRIKIARKAEHFLGSLAALFVALMLFSTVIWKDQQGLTIFLLALALIMEGAKFPAEFYGTGYITRRKQIKFIQENSINLKRLLLNSGANVKKENTEIAYYTANNKEKGLLKSDIIVSVVFTVLHVAIILCVGIFAHEIMSIVSNFLYIIAPVALLFVVVVLVLIIILVRVLKNKKNTSPKIEKWAEEYLSKN